MCIVPVACTSQLWAFGAAGAPENVNASQLPEAVPFSLTGPLLTIEQLSAITTIRPHSAPVDGE